MDRFRCIEGARAILALWVFGGHLFQQSGFAASDLPWPLNVVRTPGWAVEGFMVISGFVIARLILAKRESFPRYITRRWFRLVPLLAFCLAFMLLWKQIEPRSYQWDRSLTGDYLTAYATMLYGAIPNEILPNAAHAILPPAWSISLEWQFYLIAPLLLLTSWRFFWVIALGVLSLLVTTGSLHDLTGLTFSDAFLPISFSWFAVGMASCLLVEKIESIPSLPPGSSIVAALISFAIVGSYPLAIWIVVLGAILGDRLCNVTLSGRVIVWLGTISYSIYLVHGIVIMPVRKLIVGKAFGLEFGTVPFFLVTAAISIPIAIAVSALTYRYIELPGMRLGKIVADRPIFSPSRRTAP